MREVDVRKKSQKKKIEKLFKCEECEKTCQTKTDLRSNIKSVHPKQIPCDFCELIFCESWKYEVHLKILNKPKEHKLDEC